MGSRFEAQVHMPAQPTATDGPRRRELLRGLTNGTPSKGMWWMPAAITATPALELGLRKPRKVPGMSFIAHHRVEPDRYRVSDRDVTINRHPERDPLDPADYDRIDLLSPWNTPGLEMVMTNAYTDPDPSRFRHRTQESDLIGVVDSGGYQMAHMEAGDYLDAYDVIRWMNDAGDIGFALDPQPRWKHDFGKLEVAKALALAQRSICHVMVAEKADSLQLFNIAHGDTYDKARRCIDTVNVEGFVGWGVPLRRWDSVRTGLVLIKEYDVKWVHFLGCSDPVHLPLLAWLGRYARISCDSSTHLIGRKHGVYLLDDLWGDLKRVDVFARSYTGAGRTLGIPLTCSCSVCGAFRYGDLFRRQLPLVGSLMNLHNLNVLSRYASTLSTLALQKTMTAAKYRKHVVAPHGERAVALFDYIEIAMKRGLRDAERQASLWAEQRSDANLFREPPGDPCRGRRTVGGSTSDRYAPCEYSNLHLLPHFLDLDAPRVRKQLAPRVLKWLEAEGYCGA